MKTEQKQIPNAIVNNKKTLHILGKVSEKTLGNATYFFEGGKPLSNELPTR